MGTSPLWAAARACAIASRMNGSCSLSACICRKVSSLRDTLTLLR
jgi:hypothetical protein